MPSRRSLRRSPSGGCPWGTIYRSPPDNYLTSIYKDVFNDVGLSQHPCLQDGGPVCGIAPSHPAISGIVHFTFETPHTNMRGSSVQTQLACQCMNIDCTNIATVAIRRPPSGRAFSIDGDNGSCTYQQIVPTGEGAAAAGGSPTLHACASALMHIDAVRGDPVGPFPQENFVYNVTRFDDNFWSATGYRNGFEKEPSPPPFSSTRLRWRFPSRRPLPRRKPSPSSPPSRPPTARTRRCVGRSAPRSASRPPFTRRRKMRRRPGRTGIRSSTSRPSC
eukprot:TRINITY_DN4295_c1_g1_i1.p3 TRINITY_DN4295_c1_g1~~TRINITY_DN4295_c1_g1_i1.p3  ORF type:complete len:276 (-),score=49.56 TRINITY_DN4295_c1_g1_i1:1171-1998(-)